MIKIYIDEDSGITSYDDFQAEIIIPAITSSQNTLERITWDDLRPGGFVSTWNEGHVAASPAPNSVFGEYIEFPARKFLEYAATEGDSLKTLYIMVSKVTASNQEHIKPSKMHPQSGLYVSL